MPGDSPSEIMHDTKHCTWFAVSEGLSFLVSHCAVSPACCTTGFVRRGTPRSLISCLFVGGGDLSSEIPICCFNQNASHKSTKPANLSQSELKV